VESITVVAWPRQANLARTIALAATSLPPLPGIGPLPSRPTEIFLAPDRTLFDSLTGHRLPVWSDGAAFPDQGAIVLLANTPPEDVVATLHHELAHLALHWRVGRNVPLWFDEGYAAVAAAEWSRLDVLRLNWQLARGRRPDLESVNQALRGDPAAAGNAYALATTAVLLLQRWGGDRGLAPLLEQIGTRPSFDAALRATYGVTEGDFEERWQDDVRRRYGWLAWAEAVGLFWAVLAVALVWMVRIRRRRDRERRALLDQGWTVPDADKLDAPEDEE